MKVYENVVQGTDDWDALRLGKVTASNVTRIMPLKSGKYPADREAYKYEIITERLTGIPMPRFQSEAMRWGVLNEPYARQMFEINTGIKVQQVAFIESDEIKNVGVSPDGLIGHDAMIEIKCPHTKTHFETMISGTWNPDYYDQMQMQMGISGRKVNHFVSFDPRLPEDMKLFTVQVPFDAGYWGMMKDEIVKFLAEVDVAIGSILTRYPSHRDAYIARWK